MRYRGKVWGVRYRARHIRAGSITAVNYRNIPIGIARDTRRADSRHVQLQDQLPVQGHDPGRVTHIIKAFY